MNYAIKKYEFLQQVPSCNVLLPLHFFKILKNVKQLILNGAWL